VDTKINKFTTYISYRAGKMRRRPEVSLKMTNCHVTRRLVASKTHEQRVLWPQ